MGSHSTSKLYRQQNIIVIYTDIINVKDFERISNLSDLFPCINEFSVDLNDQDEVLRVASFSDIGSLLIKYLKLQEIKCKLMGVHQKFEDNMIVLFELKN